MDGADASTTFTDSESTPKTVTVNGNAQIDTAQSKFGGASGLFDGTGDYLSLADSADWDLSGDFFISGWWKSNARGNYLGLVDSLTSSAGTTVYTGWSLGWGYIDATNQPATFVHYPGSGTSSDLYVAGTTDVNDGVQHYIEISRSGNSWYLFLDGVQQGTTQTLSGSPVGGSGLTIGRKWTDLNQDYNNGWIDEVIFVKGTAGHTSNYTPPTAAWDDPNTSYTLTFSETITMSDTLQKATTKAFSETITLSETLIKAVTKDFSETITMSEVFSTIKGYAQTFSDTITMSDTVIKAFAKSFSDTITMSDTFSTIRGYFLTFTDTITLTDTIEKLFNRISAGIPSIGGMIRSILDFRPTGTTREKNKPGGITRDDKPSRR